MILSSHTHTGNIHKSSGHGRMMIGFNDRIFTRRAAPGGSARRSSSISAWSSSSRPTNCANRSKPISEVVENRSQVVDSPWIRSQLELDRLVRVKNKLVYVKKRRNKCACLLKRTTIKCNANANDSYSGHQTLLDELA